MNREDERSDEVERSDWMLGGLQRSDEEQERSDWTLGGLICTKKNFECEEEEEVKLESFKLKSYKLEFHVDFLPHQLPPLTNWVLKTQVLDTWDASFQHYFETWQLSKFFYI